jgi:hypothetical protein
VWRCRYEGQDEQSGERVAIKLEFMNKKIHSLMSAKERKDRYDEVLAEARMYEHLGENEGIPRIIFQGVDEPWSVLVLYARPIPRGPRIARGTPLCFGAR